MKNKKRLFFACWPDPQTREKIMAISKNIIIPNGRQIKPENLHLTLIFIGNVNADLAEQYAKAARNIKSAPFTLRLQSVGHFKKPQIAYISVPTVPDNLNKLVERLNASLLPYGYQPEQRAYRPHVSLYRKVQSLPITKINTEIVWRVDCFCLAESEIGGVNTQYRCIQEYKIK